jgi:rod shape-determining protein MreC
MLKRQYYITFGLVLLVVLVVLNLPEQKADRLKLAVGGLFLPLFGMAGVTQSLIDQAASSLAPRSTLFKQIADLHRENQQLREQLMQVQEAWRENARLRQALNWQQRAPWQLKLARVIGQDPANWWRTIIIDVGSRDREGIRTNMTVITADGLVGRISEVGMDRSRVVMVGDPTCRFSAQVQEPRDKSIVAKGIVSPSPSSLDRMLVDLVYVPGGSLLKPGQPVMTSGTGGIFPKGIIVGQIVDVRTNDYGLNLEARVKLAANLNRLEEVWVMLP